MDLYLGSNDILNPVCLEMETRVARFLHFWNPTLTMLFVFLCICLVFFVYLTTLIKIWLQKCSDLATLMETTGFNMHGGTYRTKACKLLHTVFSDKAELFLIWCYAKTGKSYSFQIDFDYIIHLPQEVRILSI